MRMRCDLPTTGEGQPPRVNRNSPSYSVTPIAREKTTLIIIVSTIRSVNPHGVGGMNGNGASLSRARRKGTRVDSGSIRQRQPLHLDCNMPGVAFPAACHLYPRLLS